MRRCRFPGRNACVLSCCIHWMANGTRPNGSARQRPIRLSLILQKTFTRLQMESRSMTKHKVVLVPFPFDDLSGTKVRPAVCLTNPIGPYRHVVLAFITSSVSSLGLATDLVLDASDAEFSSTGLRVSSTVQLHRMMTAASSLIRRELGKFIPNDAESGR